MLQIIYYMKYLIYELEMSKRWGGGGFRVDVT